MIAKVIIDLSTGEIDKTFDYRIPDGLNVRKGDRVIVPFGNKKTEGFCVDLSESTEFGELKDVIEAPDASPLITEEMLELLEHMHQTFYIRYIDILRLFIPAGMRGGRVREVLKSFVSLPAGETAESILARIPARAKAQQAIVKLLAEGDIGYTELCRQFSSQSVRKLIEDGLLIQRQEAALRTPFQAIEGAEIVNCLTAEQRDAVETIMGAEETSYLLHGVTGSGKTEIYLHCIERALQEGKGAIMLVPEISLTPQILKIFRGRFGSRVAILHSGLSDGERYDEWRRLLSGEATIVVGARSAVFAPLQNVGVIIMDEEHDQSYVSESNPRYSTLEVALFRAGYNGAKLVLGSATPSIETYRDAELGKHRLITLKKRVNGKEMPKIDIIDMADELRRGNDGLFSAEMRREIEACYRRGEQAMIFINRRGFASFVMCKKCGFIAKCSDCDVSLTYHSEDEELKCHYCGKRFRMLTACPACGSDSIRHGKVGTERVVKELGKLLPEAKILRMDNDTTKTKTAYLEILGAFAAREADILVGTQMIAKGHDFANVTLVCILDADMSLYFSDYRSSERTFQLITQVAGRAGRSDKAGRVLLQTYAPRHYVFRFAAAYDYLGFYAKERNTREVTQFPPYSRIMRVLMSSLVEEKAVACAKDNYRDLKELKERYEQDFIYLQAMKAPVKRIQNKFRYQILMRVKRHREEEIMKEIVGITQKNRMRDVSVFIETNPQNLS